MLGIEESCRRLGAKGYNKDLQAKDGFLEDISTRESFSPEDLEIAEVYRIDEDSGGGGQSVVYGIKEKHGAPLGVLVSGYGSFVSEQVARVMERLDRQTDSA